MPNYSRIIKDTLIKNYFDLRINGVSNPYQILGRKRPYQVIFILSHMRSGSSLLTHILNSNPEIIGYGETHIEYSSEQSFKELMTRVYWRIREYGMNHTYILDKLLHNNKLIDENLLKSEQISTIFLLREPQRTLASICELKPHWNQEQAATYYCDRLSKLEQYAKLINNKNRSLVLTYEQLLNNTEAVFSALQNLLHTQTEFTEEYQILQTTGVKGVGDSSDKIKAGSIIREFNKPITLINPDLQAQAIQSFAHCQDTMSQYCRHINWI